MLRAAAERRVEVRGVDVGLEGAPVRGPVAEQLRHAPPRCVEDCIYFDNKAVNNTDAMHK